MIYCMFFTHRKLQKMDEDNNIKNERKSYRKFIRPGYKPSMVCPQTDAKWRQRVISMLRNPPPVLQGSASGI